MPMTSPRLAVPLTVDRPDTVGPLTVFPLIADSSPSLHYLSFAEALQRGAEVTELAGGASVNDLTVRNPLDMPILLYEGQEVLGAQQNRTFDISVLVPARSELTVPVSCVEAGRWDGARAAETFAPAPQAGNPRLRQMKNAQARASMAAGLESRADQGEVWREVAETASRHGVDSETGALHDVFERRRAHLDAVSKKIKMYCSQVGALAAIGGQFVVLDHVSEVETFAALHGPLVQGYALDALEAPEMGPPSLADARDFVDLLLRAPCLSSPTVGLGEAARFEFGGLAGTGLVCDGKFVALTAFADRSSPSHGPGRVAPPSQRRRRHRP